MEMLVAMALTAAASASVVGLISSSAGTVDEISSDDSLAGVAVDWLADDLRQATDLDVVATSGKGGVATLDVTTPEGTIRWGSASGTVERTGPSSPGAQPVVDGLRDTDALLIGLRNASDTVVDPSDATAVDDCTRFVTIQVMAPDDSVLHERRVSLRYPLWETPTC